MAAPTRSQFRAKARGTHRQRLPTPSGVPSIQLRDRRLPLRYHDASPDEVQRGLQRLNCRSRRTPPGVAGQPWKCWRPGSIKLMAKVAKEEIMGAMGARNALSLEIS